MRMWSLFVSCFWQRIIRAMCERSFDGSFVLRCASLLFPRRIRTNNPMRILAGDNTKSTVISALRLLTDLLLTNEPFPVHSYGKFLRLRAQMTLPLPFFFSTIV